MLKPPGLRTQPKSGLGGTLSSIPSIPRSSSRPQKPETTETHTTGPWAAGDGFLFRGDRTGSGGYLPDSLAGSLGSLWLPGREGGVGVVCVCEGGGREWRGRKRDGAACPPRVSTSACVPHPIPIPAYPSLSHSIEPLRGSRGEGGRRPLLRLRWRVAWASVERSRKEGRKRKRRGLYFKK